MDGLLVLLVVLIAFAVFIYLVNRSAKTFMVLGIVVVAYIVLRLVGIIG